MIAIDTNVIVRLLVRDHPDQTAVAEALIATEDVLVLTTVLLEAAWVLANVYRLPRGDLADGLEAMAGIPTVHLEDADAVSSAIRWYRDGLDFPDALHLAQARNAEAFATFDRQLARGAARLQTLPVRDL